MKMLKEENAQGSAEYILLFGGVIVIAIVASIIYRNYADGMGAEINETEVQSIEQGLDSLSHKFD